jgi:hypothetical protein
MDSPINHPASHTIRLRYPWEKTLRIVDSSSQRVTETAAVKVSVPEPMEDLSDHKAVYQRRFNRPTSLTPNCVVRLEIESWEGQLESLSINQSPIPTGPSPISVEITEFLRVQNVISIGLSPQSNRLPQVTGSVNLVILTKEAPAS